MYRYSSSSGLQTIQSGIDKRVSICWRLVWIVTLLIGGVTTGVVVVAQTTIPNWWGSQPTSIIKDLPAHSLQPVIASDPSSGLLMAAWSNPPSEGALRNIYTVHSTDNGVSWTDPTEISTTADNSLKPDLIITQDQIFVTWVEGSPPTTIYEAERTPSTSWEMHPVPSPQPLDDYVRPRLATGAGKLHIVFSGKEENITSILYAARPITASTWVTATAIYTNTTTDERSRFPVLAVAPDGQTLHLVWQEHVFSSNEDVIMYMQGQASGDSVVWGPVNILSSRTQDMIEPDAVIDFDGNVHVTWGEVGAGAHEEQYVRYTRYVGGLWMTPTVRIDPDHVRVHDLSPYYVVPKMAVWGADDQMILCVAWHGYRTDAVLEGAAEEVLSSCSYDKGDSWSLPKNVSRSSEDNETLSVSPSIAFDVTGQLQVVWQERAGAVLLQDYEIYHSYAIHLVFMPLLMRNG